MQCTDMVSDTKNTWKVLDHFETSSFWPTFQIDLCSSVTSWNAIQGLWVVYSLEWHWGPAVSVVNLLTTRWLLTCQPVNIHVNLTPLSLLFSYQLIENILMKFFYEKDPFRFLDSVALLHWGRWAFCWYWMCAPPHTHTKYFTDTCNRPLLGKLSSEQFLYKQNPPISDITVFQN